MRQGVCKLAHGHHDAMVTMMHAEIIAPVAR